MAGLRRQGFSFEEIGARVHKSERTARRYVGKVEPQLQIPKGNQQRDVGATELREGFVRELLEVLYRDKRLNELSMTWQGDRAVYGGPPSMLFLSEAEQLLRERLEDIGAMALRLLARDQRSKDRFLREVVGPVYREYVHWHEFAQKFGDTGEDWQPLRQRWVVEADDEVE